MAAVYLISGIVSLSIFHEHTIITMSAFFPEGFALAGVLLFGKRVLPGIFLGQFLLAIYSGFSLVAGIEIGISNTLEAYIALLLFRHFKLDSHLRSLRDLFGILILIMVILQPFSALAGNTILYLNGIISESELPSSIFYWWIGNVLGQMLLTPMLLLLYHNRSTLHIRSLVLIIITTVVLNYIFQVLIDIHNTSLLLILTLPATIYLSTRNINYASVSSVLLASISLYFAQKGIGTFSHNPSMIDNLLNLNYFMASHVILVLLVGVLFKEKQEAIEQLQKMAHIDALTGLPNRHILREEIHHAVSMSDQYGDRSAICYIDVDHFKPINDSLGHHIGDEVLKTVASRIKKVITARDALLRIGGDEFLLILNKITDTQSVEKTLKRINSSISKPITIENNTLHLSCSIGVAFCPDHGITTKTLMESADSAMYMAKASQRGSIFIIDIPKKKESEMISSYTKGEAK
jgi:diguanylate cyclase (GGDEF)-like protein